MQKIFPCLWFGDQAEQAAEFYVSVFERSSILEVSRYGPGAPLPEGTALVVTVEIDGVVQVAVTEPTDGSDLPVVADGTRDLVVSGSGDIGAEVVVSVDGQTDQTVTVQPDGTWTATFPGIGEGTYEITATQTVSGQTSTQTVTVTITEEVDVLEAVAILTPEDGDTIVVPAGETVDLDVTGSGEPGADVAVTVEGQGDPGLLDQARLVQHLEVVRHRGL